MNHDEKQDRCDEVQLLSKFKEDLRVCRESLLEAKQRIIMLEQRLRFFLTCLILVLICATLYGTIQVWQTSAWLHEFAYYVRYERDPQWEKWMNEVRYNQDLIKNRIEKTQPQ